MRRFVWLIGLVFMSGCGILVTDVRLPYAYRSATPADVKASKDDPMVTGQSCSTSVLYLVMWGNGGYAAAVKDALKNDPNATLYDVKMDVKVRSYLLGLYSHACTIATGKVGHP